MKSAMAMMIWLTGATTTFAADEPAAKNAAVTQKLQQLEAAGRHAVNPTAYLSKEQRGNALKLANEFTQKVAGGDDRKYTQTLQASYRAAVAAALDLKESDLLALEATPSALRSHGSSMGLDSAGRMRDVAPVVPHRPARSIVDNPHYAKNMRKLMDLTAKVDDLNPAGPSLRIIGGIAEAENKFPDCVCVGGAGGYCCTGTLVGKNVVVTAGHCYPCIRFGTKAFIGQDINRPGKEYAGKAYRHPQYGQDGVHNDLCVIVLDQDVTGVTPRPIAATAEINAAFAIRAVGYGTTDFNGTMGFGIRRYVDLPVVLALCTGAANTNHYGCDMDLELVAGMVGLDTDTCKGDSGGPVYILSGTEWKLAGATSRATDEATRVCGDGGIYVRVDKYADWIKSVEGGRW